MNNKSILITGGTGSFGREFVKRVFEIYPDVRKVAVYSRDELKQYEMHQQFPDKDYPNLRFFLGDVRDCDRLTLACQDVDVVVHAAALKQVPAAEYNPMECIKTNIFGAENVIKAALKTNVSEVIALSTDKAAAPVNLYGATKLCSDKLFVAANNLKGKKNLKFSVVRYGNVLGSRGSVIPYFIKKRNSGVIPITHPEMTRFSISLREAIDFVLDVQKIHWGGETFIPKIPSYRILDVAAAIAPECETQIVGIRPGEKLHEEMITKTDAFNTVEFNKYFVILPSVPAWGVDEFIDSNGGQRVGQGFSYNSGDNKILSVEQIRDEIHKHVDSSL